MDSKKIKLFIIIFGLIAIYSVSIYFLASNKDMDRDEPIVDPEKSDDKSEKYGMLIINNTTFWKFEDNNFKNSNSNSVGKDFYNVYVNNEYRGKYTIKYNGVVNLFDENDKYYDYGNNNVLAYTYNYNGYSIIVNDYLKTEAGEEELFEASRILKSNILTDSLSKKEKIVIDLDNNGVDDKIVYLSNVDYTTLKEEYFNLLYVVLNNKVQVITNENYTSNDILQAPIYGINYILNINSNVNKNIVISKGYFSLVGSPGNVMYEYKNGEYVKVIED